MKTKDAGNMYWRNIPRGHLTRGNKGADGKTASWSAINPKTGDAYLLNWNGQEASSAQAELNRREHQDARKLAKLA